MARLRILGRWSAGIAGLGLLTAYGMAFQVHLMTMGFLYLLVVVAVAALGNLCISLQPASLLNKL